MQTRRPIPGNFLREQHAQTVRNPNTVLQLAAAAAISQPPAGRDMREFPTRVNRLTIVISGRSGLLMVPEYASKRCEP